MRKVGLAQLFWLLEVRHTGFSNLFTCLMPNNRAWNWPRIPRCYDLNNVYFKKVGWTNHLSDFSALIRFVVSLDINKIDTELKNRFLFYQAIAYLI
ncbi:MAG: hypothetical protein F6K22_18745 [Okeania sp. SIO2F4]|uniref:hypothetical protein n=1 Tax=Okeania sp. SIO2F4 TaxID=2607790 RepID=UPI00142B3B09|nr:hypothetical protein [Okeania sp. SIO2F4]NES04688.1 hypothetical protein [Okeania sp. SIO2F4]